MVFYLNGQNQLTSWPPWCSRCCSYHESSTACCPQLPPTTDISTTVAGIGSKTALERIDEMIEGLQELRDELQRKGGV